VRSRDDESEAAVNHRIRGSRRRVVVRAGQARTLLESRRAACGAPRSSTSGSPHNRGYEQGARLFEDWWFAVRVEAKKLMVPTPADWRELQGVTVARVSPTRAGPWRCAAGRLSAFRAPRPALLRLNGTNSLVSRACD
jgi:hypothetical protein